VNGTVTVFHYSLTGQLIAESNSAGNITTEYVYLNGQPLTKIEGANTYYYHNDALGTPQKMTDASGTVVWSADYKPFGEATVTISTITNNLRLPGQYFDQETGTHYNYFRDYNPMIGRYIQGDRIGLRGGLNLYSYVGNRPTRFKDLFGLIENPLPTLPPFSEGNPNSNYVAPIADIIVGSIETGFGVAGSVGAVVITVMQPELWPLAAILAPASLDAGTDGLARIQAGIDRLGHPIAPPTPPTTPIKPAQCH
jgi:RHS repeat-associated protein